MTSNQRSVVVTLLSLVLTSGPAHAQFGVNVNVKTESTVVAGLDDKTRAWISQLPAEFRKQMLMALEDALPLVDRSVNGYLEHVDQLISDNLNQLTCIAPAAAKGMAENVIATFTGKPPTPLSDLDKRWSTFGSRFQKTATAHEVAIAYEEFLSDAAITACQLVITPEARSRVDRIRTIARANWRVWIALDEHCGLLASCLTQRIGEVRTLLNNTDPRDIRRSGSSEVVARVAVPQPPGVLTGMLYSFDFRPYEQQLTSLHEGQRAIETAQRLRLATGRYHLAAARQSFEEADNLRRQARSSVSDSDPQANNTSMSLADRARSKESEITVALDAAFAADDHLQDEVEEVRRNLALLKTDLNSIKSAATSKTAAFQAAQEAAREAERRRRQEIIDRREQRRQDGGGGVGRGGR